MIACDTGSRYVTGHWVSSSLPEQECRGGVWWSGGRDTELFLDRPLGLRTTPRPGPTAKGCKCVQYIHVYVKKNLWDHVFVLCG